MVKNKLTRVLALALALVCLVTAVGATNLVYDRNGDGKTNVWDLQLLTKEEADTSGALIEALGGHDELHPVDGVYHIYSELGLYNMAKLANKGYTFKLMADIDMEGKEWTPIASFKGILDGNGKTISNFKITKAVGTTMGFFAKTAKEDDNTPRTVISNLHLRGMQLIVDGTDDAVNENEGVRYIGAIVGENFGDVADCTTICTVVDKRQLGNLKKTYYGTLVGNNAERTTDTGKIPLGVISGSNVLDLSVNITEESKKPRENTVPYKTPDTKVNSKMAMFLSDSVDYATKVAKTQVGIAGNTNRDGMNTSLLWQDLSNSTDLAEQALQERREAAAAMMYELCTVEWKPAKTMYNYSNYSASEGWGIETKVNTAASGILTTDKGVQRGLAYAHSVTSLARFNDLVRHYTGELELWDNRAYHYNTQDAFTAFQREDQDQTGWGLYIGSDCIGQVSSAWRFVTAVDKGTPGWAKLVVTGQTFACEQHMEWYGFQAVNDLVFDNPTDLNEDGKTNSADLYQCLVDYTKTNKNHYMDALAMVSKADVLIGYSKAGNGHALMALGDAVVVRNYGGGVDINRSYITTAEQGGSGADSDGIDRYSYTTTSGIYKTIQWSSTCYVDRRSTFAALIKENVAGATSWIYFPVTCDVLRNADSPAANATVSLDAAGQVKSNFFIVSVAANGETVYSNMEEKLSSYRGGRSAVNLTEAFSGIEAGTPVTVRLANGTTYTGVFGTAGLTEVK